MSATIIKSLFSDIPYFHSVRGAVDPNLSVTGHNQE
jgi:hypothetical protein